MHIHRQTHSYIYSHTHLKLKLKKRRVTRICRYNVRVCRKVKAQRGPNSARNFCQLKSKERFSHERSDARKKRERRETECKFAEESQYNMRSRIARTLSRLSLLCGCVCVSVCKAGQAREALRASINKFAESDRGWGYWMCLIRLLYATCGHVQHESMTKTPMQPYSNNLTPPLAQSSANACTNKQRP